MTQRRGRHASPDNTKLYRSLALLILSTIGVAAVVFGMLVFLSRGPSTTTTLPQAQGPSTTTPAPSSSTTEASTTTTAPSTTTTVRVRSPGEVRVQVLNSMGLAGAAGRLTARLAADGYQTVQADDYSPELTPTRVWYREGFSAEANALLAYVPDGRVEPLPDPAVGEGVDVVIVLGTTYQE